METAKVIAEGKAVRHVAAFQITLMFEQAARVSEREIQAGF